MPPFLPNLTDKRPSTRSRRATPTSVEDSRPSLGERRSKKTATDWADVQVLSDWGSQPDTEGRPTQTPRPRHKMPRTPERNPRPGTLQPEISHHADHASLPSRPPQIPSMPVYEHCLILRKHGAAVRFSSATSPHMIAQGPMSRPPVTTTDHFHQDVHDPSVREIQLINQALAFVRSCGGEVEFHALTREQSTPYFQCGFCSETFTSRADKDVHCDGGRRGCRLCGEQNLNCLTDYEQHMRDLHRVQPGLATSDTRSEVAWNSDTRRR